MDSSLQVLDLLFVLCLVRFLSAHCTSLSRSIQMVALSLSILFCSLSLPPVWYFANFNSYHFTAFFRSLIKMLNREDSRAFQYPVVLLLLVASRPVGLLSFCRHIAYQLSVTRDHKAALVGQRLADVLTRDNQVVGDLVCNNLCYRRQVKPLLSMTDLE